MVVGDYMGSNPASACEKEMEQIKVAGCDITSSRCPMSGQHAHVHAGPGGHRGRGRPDRLDRQSRCSIATGPMYWGLAQLRRSFDFVQSICMLRKILPPAKLLSDGVKACRIFAGSKIVPICAAILSALTGPLMRVRVSTCYRERLFHALFYRFEIRATHLIHFTV